MIHSAIRPNQRDAPFRVYSEILLGVTGVALGLILLLNYLVDPYLTHQWDSPLLQRLRPSWEKNSPWGKTYAVARFRPEVLYLGNSRTEAGLSPAYPAFAGKKVFNAGISGATLADVIVMARHALAHSHVSTVVWGLDYWSFSTESGNTSFDRSIVGGGRFYFLWRTLLDAKRALSVDMTRDSVRTLLGTSAKVCRSSLASYGQRDRACSVGNLQDRGGAARGLESDIKAFSHPKPITAAAMQEFDSAIAELCAAGVQARLYISPTHATMVESLFRTENWARVGAWEESLANRVAMARRSGCDIRLFDFSGFNSINSEPIPQQTGKDMSNFWEASHFRENVGNLVLDRLFGAEHSGLPADFGVELEPGMMPGHMKHMEEARRRYQESQAAAAELVRQLVAP
ncbi:MAG: hypothetical protein PHU46_10985 [Rhodocyclaceae bacterium]|nr:hypothetical protein [Rhodocyclaceae bacterium]